MVKLNLLTHHVTALAFPGNCCFGEILFPLVLWRFLLKGLQQSQLPIHAPHGFSATSLPWMCLQGERGGCEMGKLFTAGLRVNGETHRKGRCMDPVSCDLVVLKGLEESVPSLTQASGFLRHSDVLENPRKREKCIALCSWSSGLWRDQRSTLMQTPLGSETH